MSGPLANSRRDDTAVTIGVIKWCIDRIRTETDKRAPDYEEAAKHVQMKLWFLHDWLANKPRRSA